MTEDMRNLVPTNIEAGALKVANATETVTISNVAPTGVGTATISGWLRVRVDGTDCYMPYWT